MQQRVAALLLSALGLGACASSDAPRTGVFAATLPRLAVFGYAAPDPAPGAVPYKLTGRDVADVKAAFSALFTDGRSLSFGPIDASRRTDGTIAICGLVSVRRLDGTQSNMKLFDGTAAFDPFGALSFQPNRMAGANGKFLDMYTDCRAAGLLGRNGDAGTALASAAPAEAAPLDRPAFPAEPPQAHRP